MSHKMKPETYIFPILLPEVYHRHIIQIQRKSIVFRVIYVVDLVTIALGVVLSIFIISYFMPLLALSG